MSLLALLWGEEPPAVLGTPLGLVTEQVRVEIALSHAPFVLSPTWTRFDTVTRRAAWSYSRGGVTEQASPSQFQALVYNDGRWDKTTGLGGSPWAGNVDRWKGIRVVGSDDGFATSEVLWRGFVDDVRFLDDKWVGWARVDGIDMCGVLSEIELEDLERPAELAGVRVAAILTAAGIPAGWQESVASGTVALAAATISGSAWSLIQECARSEGGLAYVSRAGLFRFIDRYWFFDTASTSAVTIDDDVIKAVVVPGSLGAQEAVHVGSSAGSTGRMFTYGTPPTDTPAASSRSRSTSAVWDADAKAMAEYLQRNGNYSPTRVDEVTLDVWPYGDTAGTAVRDGVVSGDISWLRRADVSFTPAHGEARSQLSWIEEESHGVEFAAGTWSLVLGLSPLESDYANRAAEFYYFGLAFNAQVGAV
jgi:hypothetical protein